MSISSSRWPLLAALAASSTLAIGCAADAERSSSSEDLTEVEGSANAAFDDEVDGMLALADAQKAGACPARDGAARPAAGSVKILAGKRPSGICAALAPFKAFDHPYFFMGGALSAQARSGYQAGLDLVWDLDNLQAATFVFHGPVFGTTRGVSAGAYAGFGFATSKKSSVLDAWSGVFQSATVSASLVGVLGASGTGFRSPDNSLLGGSIGISVGVSDLPVNVDAAPASVWSAWDAGTEAYDGRIWDCTFGKSLRSVTYDKKPHKVVQFQRSRGIAAAILWETGGNALGQSAAYYALALGALRQSGLTVSQACP
ncbi:MAG: hypothetical protein JNL38_41785 [Myxococcales bacterium]|nr:hypothetical protein [Myxococcales bacterium]